MWFEASAPGSLMLLGEYAVLHGKTALVGAIDKRITVRLQPRSHNIISIRSALGELSTDRLNLTVSPPFQFILTALKKFQKQLPSGCDIEVISEFSSQVGFASSAAVTAATLAALKEWLGLSISQFELAYLGRRIIRAVQGRGSGADIAACLFGGVVAFSARPFSIEKLPFHYPLTVIYSGYKTPTAEAIAIVDEAFSKRKTLFRDICRAIGSCAAQGREAFLKQDWIALGNIMNTQQGLMDALGVNTPQLQTLIHSLRENKNILGAKISGSGLGDCVIGLGVAGEDLPLKRVGQPMDIQLSDRGVICEKR